ncbi:MAG: FAD:protein transferase, partial [Subtercola sp.]|nr:FAD:protein transferase [Subtercola sp.]
DAATTVLAGVLAEIERACSRFSPTSELAVLRPRLAAGAPVSPMLAQLVRVALRAARRTGGSVDPTLGNAMSRLGYDRDFDELSQPRTASPSRRSARGPAAPVITLPPVTTLSPVTTLPPVTTLSPVITLSSAVPGWRRVGFAEHDGETLLVVPADLTLDLGATAKAFAADLAAARVFEALGCGVLVSLGGDIATAGPAPEGGWQVTVQDLPEDPGCQVTLAPGQALATSSTQKRRWRQGGQAFHHILDPARGDPADPVWRTATVAASSCVEANTLATASIVRGTAALTWLSAERATARLVDRAGRVLSLGGWPDENSVHVRAVG